jgi:hypothetical protein
VARQRKGPTREERRQDWIRAGGQAEWSLIEPAFADPTFGERYAQTLATLETDDEATYKAALRELKKLLHRFVPSTEWDRADKLLAVNLAYDLERRAGRSDAEAFAVARRFRPLRYPLSAENPAELDLSGAMHLPLSLSRQQRAEAAQFVDDVLADRPRRGRPTGSRAWGHDEWVTAWHKVDAEFRQNQIEPTDEQRADAMGIPPKTFSTYKRVYGVPPRP